MKHTRRFITIFTAAVLMLMPIFAFAEETTFDMSGYSLDNVQEGELFETDPFTGAILTGPEADLNRVEVTYDCYYDRNLNMYEYEVLPTADGYVRSTVANGMVVNQTVAIEIGTGITGSLYRNGETYEGNLENIKDPGSYVLNVNADNSVKKLLTFTVVNSITGALNVFEVPEGFALSVVTFNGTPTPTNASSVDLTTEGDYIIDYFCTASQVGYSLAITVDHTAPTLALEALENGIASGPVSIADLEEGASIYIELNGKQINYSDTLTRTGKYYIIVQDKAGNSSNYSFEIRLYFDINTWVVILLIIAVLCGIAGYILYTRKHLRVR